MSRAGPRPASAPAARPTPRTAAAGSEAANVTVCVRVRPANELERGKPNLVNIVDDNCIVFDPHDADAQQALVRHEAEHEALRDAVQGDSEPHRERHSSPPGRRNESRGRLG